MEKEQLLKHAMELVNSSAAKDEKLQKLCELLAEQLPGYDWVGFYLVDPAADNELVLGPYVGDPTEHVRIKFGEGICGQAADLKKTFIVADVSKEDNYLSCSPDVKSEIVVPIFKDGKIVGEIDIDSHNLGNFKEQDRMLLEELATLIAPLF